MFVAYFSMLKSYYSVKSLILSVIFTALLGQIPARAQVDSAQWPFPNVLIPSCQLSGIYTIQLNEKPNIDSTWSGPETRSVPEWTFQPIQFDRNDVEKFESNEWQLLNSVALTAPITLDLFLDTAHHRIDTLTYQYSGSEMPEEGLSVELKNLNYSDSTIDFGDNDLWRHLCSASYSQLDENSDEYNTIAFCCPYGFTIFGQTLVPGFLLTHQVNFGMLAQDSSRDTNIRVINYSDSAVSILSFALNDPDSGFAFVDTIVHIIPAEDSENITIRFTPRQLKSYSGEITIVTDEACSNAYTVNLNGVVTPSSVQGNSVDSSFTASLVTQEGRLLLQLSSSFSSAQIDVFDILGHKCASMDQSLNAGENFIPLNDLIGTHWEYIVRIQSGSDVRSLKFVIAQ